MLTRSKQSELSSDGNPNVLSKRGGKKRTKNKKLPPGQAHPVHVEPGQPLLAAQSPQEPDVAVPGVGSNGMTADGSSPLAALRYQELKVCRLHPLGKDLRRLLDEALRFAYELENAVVYFTRLECSEKEVEEDLPTDPWCSVGPR